LLTGTGNAGAGLTLANNTATAKGGAAQTGSGNVYLHADGGTALTATTAAALFAATTTASKWAITSGGVAHTEFLIETGATTTSDTIWEIDQAAGGTFTAVKIVGVTVVAAHDIAFANLG